MFVSISPTGVVLTLSAFTLGGFAYAATFEPTQALSDDSSYAVVALDADNDGDQDLVFGQYDDYGELWLNDGTGRFSNAGVDLGNSYTSNLQVVDSNGDNIPDLMMAGASSYKTATAHILENSGSGGFSEIAHISLSGEEVGGWAAGDFNNDSHLDLVALTHDGFLTHHSTLSVWYGSASGYPTDPDQHTMSDYKCTSVANADLAGSAGDEIVIGCTPYSVSDGDTDTDYPGGIQVWRHDGSELAALSAFLQTDWDIGDIGFTDLDGNGDLDVVGTHYNSMPTVSVSGNQHSVWTNTGGTFSPSSLDFNGIRIEIADVDNDTHDDLIIADGRAIRLHLGDGNGQFQEQTGAVESCDAYAQAVAAADLNGDAKADLAVAGTPYYNSTDPADLVIIQNGSNQLCDNTEGGDNGTGDNDADGEEPENETTEDTGGGGVLGPIALLTFGLLGRFRRRQC